jgi:hypothetical protein
MMLLKSSEQLELSFSPCVYWRKLSCEKQQELLEQLSLLLLSYLDHETKQHKSTEEDQSCQEK